MKTKICSRCGEEKNIENDFTKKKSNKDGYCENCKECTRFYANNHYKFNKDYYKNKARENEKKYIKKNREYIINYLKKHPCVDCGEDNIIVLEFDHRERKEKEHNVPEMMKSSNTEKLEKEISKCDVRCANCHRIKTSEQMGWYKWLAIV